MALTVQPFDERCVPPINQVNLAYHPNSPDSFNNTEALLTSKYSVNGVMGIGDKLTVPVQCNGGMDIVFLIDYTGSMSGAINGVKQGLNNILSTINEESSGNYRVGFCLFDEYNGNPTSPSQYGDNSAYTDLPASQKVRISNGSKTQFITCMSPLGIVGESSNFQSQLNKINNIMSLGFGGGEPEPGGLGINEIISTGISGSFRSDAIKVVVLITDNIPGGTDDLNTSADATYLNNLRKLSDSLDVQIMVQSTKSRDQSNNYYTSLINTTPAGRYDQVSFDSGGNWINTGLIAGIQSLCTNSFTPSCNSAATGWYYEPEASYSWYYDANLEKVTSKYTFPPTYSVRVIYKPDVELIGVDENSERVTWIVTTEHVPNGTDLYWNMNSGNTVAADFIEGVSSGLVRINNNTGSFYLTTKPDGLREGFETIQINIRTGSTNGTIVVTADPVHLDDSSTPKPSPTPTPTPTAVTSYPIYVDNLERTGTRRSTDPCGTARHTLYSLTQGTYRLKLNDRLYSTPGLTSTWDGDNEFYGLTDFYNSTAFLKVQIDGFGKIIYIGDCYTATPIPTSTPTPTPTPTSTSSGGGSGFYHYQVECVSGSCPIGVTLVVSDVSSNLTGAYVNVSRMGGCWKVIGITSTIGDNSISGLCSPPPPPEPTPTPTPTTSTPSTFKYLMDPCNGTGPYVVASTNSPKQLYSIWSLTGITYSDQAYTIIGTSSESPVTTIGMGVSDCNDYGGGGRES